MSRTLGSRAGSAGAQQNAGGRSAPGPCQLAWHEDLTQTEYALVRALREALRVEGSWYEFERREALEFLRMMMAEIEAGRAKKACRPVCDPDQFPLLYEAALATVQWVRFFIGQKMKHHIVAGFDEAPPDPPA